MLALPISLIVSLFLGVLIVQAVTRDDRPWLFASLLAACALQGLVVSLVQYYGITLLRPVQPITATFVPPLAWVAFQASVVRGFQVRRDLPHLGVPIVAALCSALVPEVLDLVVPGIFLTYGAAILLALRSRAGELPRARLETGDRPRLIWGGIALALILSAASDALIAVAQISGEGWLRPLVISVFASLSLGLVGVLILSQSLAGSGEAVDTAPRVVDTSDAMRDAEIMAELDTLLVGGALYLDSGLTLERLARRLRIPAKPLSAAINRSTRGNVSRYVNGFRIRRACELLAVGENVTNTMLASGFNTKSNFNREFLRVTGSSPSAWLARDRGASSEPA